MKLIQLQLAWFFTSPQYPEYETISSTIRSRVDVGFMSPPMILPIPPSAPAEIPRLQMTTEDGAYRFSMAPIRADIFSTATAEQLSESDIKLFRSFAVKASDALLASMIKVSRLGVVARMIQETSEASKIIQNAFLKDASRNIKELSLKIVERHTVDGILYNNSWQYDEGIKMPEDVRILIVTRDINTAPEAPIDMTAAVIEKILDFIIPQLSEDGISKCLEA